MPKKVLQLTPDQLSYKDRGKMKWLGLMQSNHTEALKRMSKEDEAVEPLPKKKMTQEKISEVLQIAYVNKAPIVMQANVITNGHYYQDLKCMVLGYADNKIYLQLKDERRTSCELSQLRNISFMDPAEWYEKS